MEGKMNTKLIVTDVPATLEWLRENPVFAGFKAVPFLGRRVDSLEPGDIVVGSLPLVIAAQICGAGAEYWHINFRRPRKQHRKLTADELRARATVERYTIEEGERIA